MQPLLLKFRGFYSYIEEEEIDFTSLNQARLFGIFGKTGSGKSAILDAISFAFFGKIDRHLDNETKAFINIYSKEGFVDFTFKVQKRGYGKEYTTYRVLRKFAITEKKSKEVESEVLVYDEFGNVLSTKIKESNILLSEILNIKEEDFSKIICLPQGKFNKFLHDTPSNRTNFLLKIFNIEKYEVKDELKNKINSLKNELDLLEKEILAILSFGFENSDDIKIETINKHIEDLKFQQKELLEKIKNLENQEKVVREEKEVLDKAKVIQDEKLKAFNEINGLRVNYKTLEEKLEKEKKEQDRAIWSKKVNHTLPYFNNFKKCDNSIKKGTLEVENLKVSLKDMEKELESFKDFENFQKEKQKLIQVLNITKEKTDILLKEDKEEKYEVVLKEQEETLNKKSKVLEKAKEDYEIILAEKERVFSELEKLKKDIIINEKNQKLLEDRETLGAFLIKLEEDGVCPLCGSESHPNKVKVTLEKEFIKNKEEKIELANKKISMGKGLVDFIKATRKTDIEYNEDNFEMLVINKINSFLQKIMETEQEFEKEKNLFIIKKDKYKNYIERAMEIAKDIDLDSFCKSLKEKISSEERELETKIKKYNTLKENFTKTKENITSKEEFLKGQKEDFLTYEKEYNDLVKKYEFSNFEVEKEGAYSLEKIENILENYDILKESIAKVKALLLEKEKIIEAIDFSALEKESKDTIENIKVKEESLKDIATTTGVVREQIKKIHYIFNNIDDKKEEHISLKSELLDYETLEKIVGKKKLVNYIINMKMNKLIENANIHLSKITKDKYQLICSPSLEFLVYERHLNKTFTRNIKSLSGGETFIFSLCLSLALSKELQKNSENKFEFFFIDEGFGTLDEDKLQKIYETLSILSEDMTIGFITHVPFMKNFVQHKLLVGENINGEDILEGKKISIV